jgi:YVTN family beta-propeller protein
VRELAQLPYALTHASGALLGGLVYVFGGRGSTLGSQTARILAIDPASGRVARAGMLPVALSDSGAAPAGGGVVVAGGRMASGTVSDHVYLLTPAAAHFSRLRLPGPLAQAQVGPPPLDPNNVYAADRTFSPVVMGFRPLIYVPNSASNTVSEIDPTTYKVVRTFPVGALPQHVVPSYDLKTLWVTNDMGNSLTPIDPVNGDPGKPVPVTDPYNMYFTPDGRYAVVMAERLREMDFRDAQTMKLHYALHVPQCAGVNHADYTADGRFMLVSCEFGAAMIVVDVTAERVTRTLPLPAGSSPQDVKLSPDGRIFYVADLNANGVWEFDAQSFNRLGLIKTGAGAHGLYPSRDTSKLYVSNRKAGSVSVVSFATRSVVAAWQIPGGGSPDMGGVSASGHVLWLTGRYDAAVYAINARTGRLIRKVSVGLGPHGLSVYPQPGRYSLGHTGVMR